MTSKRKAKQKVAERTALKMRDPIMRDFFLGRITASERERRIGEQERLQEEWCQSPSESRRNKSQKRQEMDAHGI